ncbi:unnamed protein product [Adineta steineri]|uniref:Uncharacterized protein n=1 Tax=Adineta steineri TaxID=433720 RepID=A0A815DQ71_9BILA|nr:unnamed protein product [Adineta steineri]
MNFLFLGDILIFLNERNLLKSPIVLTNEHIKSEFAALRRHNKPIRIGICRCTDRSLLNNTTIKHLGSITFDEFQKLSIDNRSTPSLDESRKSLVIVDEIITNIDSKHVSNKHQTKPLIYKRSTSPARDSGFIETDGTNTSVLTDRSVNSNYIKRRSKVSLEKSEDDSTDTHKSLDSLQHSISKPIEEIKSKPSGLIKTVDELEQMKIESKEEPIVDEHNVEILSQISESTQHESETTVLESQLPIVSPIDTLVNTVPNRYISSDVYHGYLGEHKQFMQNDILDVDDDDTKKSLLASLRETITAPITPLIETIQGVVSSLQTTTETHSLKTESETTLTATDIKETDEGNEPTVNTSEESKTVFESIREAITTPITALAESIQTTVSNFQSEEQETPSIDEEKLASNVTSSLSDNIQENVTTTDSRTEDEVSVASDAVQDETVANKTESYDSLITDTTISTSSNIISTPAEEVNEQKEKTSVESLSSEIPEPTSTAIVSEQTDITDKQNAISSEEAVSSITIPEQVDTTDKQEVIPIETIATEKSNELTTEQNIDENTSTETKTTLEILRDVVTHPLATLNEKLQSILPTSVSEQTEETILDAIKSSTDISKETEVTIV